MTQGAPAGGVSSLFWGLSQDICWAEWSNADLSLPSIFSRPSSLNGEPNFIWTSVINAAGIFRGWLAVAAAATHTHTLIPSNPAPFQPSLPDSLAAGQWQNKSWCIHQAVNWKTVAIFLSATCNLTPNSEDTSKKWHPGRLPANCEWKISFLIFLQRHSVIRRYVENLPKCANKPRIQLKSFTELRDCCTVHQITVFMCQRITERGA